MNPDLLKEALTSIQELTDEELQVEFEVCKDGPVGRAVLGLVSK